MRNPLKVLMCKISGHEFYFYRKGNLPMVNCLCCKKEERIWNEVFK